NHDGQRERRAAADQAPTGHEDAPAEPARRTRSPSFSPSRTTIRSRLLGPSETGRSRSPSVPSTSTQGAPVRSRTAVNGPRIALEDLRGDAQRREIGDLEHLREHPDPLSDLPPVPVPLANVDDHAVARRLDGELVERVLVILDPLLRSLLLDREELELGRDV